MFVCAKVIKLSTKQHMYVSYLLRLLHTYAKTINKYLLILKRQAWQTKQKHKAMNEYECVSVPFCVCVRVCVRVLTVVTDRLYAQHKLLSISQKSKRNKDYESLAKAHVMCHTVMHTNIQTRRHPKLQTLQVIYIGALRRCE